MIFAAIADWAESKQYPVEFMCAELGVSSTGTDYTVSNTYLASDWVDVGFPPVDGSIYTKIFIAHGVKDTTMPIDVSGRKNVKQLKAEGYDVTYHEHDGGHGTPAAITRQAILWFLGRTQ